MSAQRRVATDGTVQTYYDRFGGEHRYLKVKQPRVAFRVGRKQLWEWRTIGAVEERA